jgi:hypothetical protein
MITKRKKAPMVLSKYNGDDEEVIYVPCCKKMPQAKAEAIQQLVEDVANLGADLEVRVIMEEVESDNLPQTLNFGGRDEKPIAQDRDESDKETVFDGNQSSNLLEADKDDNGIV